MRLTPDVFQTQSAMVIKDELETQLYLGLLWVVGTVTPREYWEVLEVMPVNTRGNKVNRNLLL